MTAGLRNHNQSIGTGDAHYETIVFTLSDP